MALGISATTAFQGLDAERLSRSLDSNWRREAGRIGSSKKTGVDRKGMVVRVESGRTMVKQSQVRNVRSKGVVINHKYRSF